MESSVEEHFVASINNIFTHITAIQLKNYWCYRWNCGYSSEEDRIETGSNGTTQKR